MSWPWFAAAVVPTDDVTDRTSGSRATIAATCRCASTSASNETPSAASVVRQELAGVVGGEEPLGDDPEEPGRRGQDHRREDQRSAPVLHHPGEARS